MTDPASRHPQSDVTLGEIARRLDDLRLDLRDWRQDHERRLRFVERAVWAAPAALLIGLVQLFGG